MILMRIASPEIRLIVNSKSKSVLSQNKVGDRQLHAEVVCVFRRSHFTCSIKITQVTAADERAKESERTVKSEKQNERNFNIALRNDIVGFGKTCNTRLESGSLNNDLAQSRTESADRQWHERRLRENSARHFRSTFDI